MAKQNSKKLLEATIAASRTVIGRVSDSFSKPWMLNPGTGARAALGKWLTTSARHLVAIIILAKENDLSMVADVHYRQIFEILLQVRYFIASNPSDQEKLAEKISAWGCLDYLEKLAPLKDHDQVRKGFQEMTEQLSKYDPDLISTIRTERKKYQHWFTATFTDLARRVSRNGEDLAAVYKITSGELHGVWDLAIGVSNPKPGSLDFRGYPDTDTMQRWAADLVDRATQHFVVTWNDIAGAVGAPQVELAIESDSKIN